MSQTTTTPLKAAPAGATDIPVTTGGTTWSNGAWVTLLAATSAPAALAGVVCSAGFSDELEIDLGTGAAGSEVVVTTLRVRWGGSNFGGVFVVWLPSPVTGLASGVRVAARGRSGSLNAPFDLALLYYETLDATNQSALPTKSLPAAANGATVTPNGTAWANSAYAQLTSGLGVPISIHGITFTSSVANVDGEWDLATGGAGAETVLTTLRFATASNANAGGINNLLLPAPVPIAASTRVAVRLRKSGTSTTTYPVGLLYDGSTGAPAPVTGTGTLSLGGAALAGSGGILAPVVGGGAVVIGVSGLAATGVLYPPQPPDEIGRVCAALRLSTRRRS